MARTAAQPKVECWFSELGEERIEIFLKVEHPRGDDRKIRASGPREDMYELAQWFEDKTGLRIDHPTWRDRVRKGPRPLDGQTSLELSLGATLHADG